MPNLGMPEIAMLAVLALLIFGPQRLPEVARGVGKAISQFKREATNTLDDLKQSADFDDMKGVAEEFRSTTRELKESTRLSGPVASTSAVAGTKARSAVPAAASTVRADVPPPFDPDAT